MNLYKELLQKAKYCQRSKDAETLLVVYGMVKMAYEFQAITHEQWLQLNHETIYYYNTHPEIQL